MALKRLRVQVSLGPQNKIMKKEFQPLRYIEQLKSTRRWYKKLELIYHDELESADVLEKKDIIFAFFQNCYHLKDWIKNDPSLEINKQIVEDFIKGNLCFTICGAVCVGSKHLEITDGRFKEYETIGTNYVLGDNKKHTFSIIYDKKRIDVKKIAAECMEKWEKFIKSELKQQSVIN